MRVGSSNEIVEEEHLKKLDDIYLRLRGTLKHPDDFLHTRPTVGCVLLLRKATKRLTEIFLMQTCDFPVIPFPVITLDHYCWLKPMSALKFSIRHVRRTNSAQGGQAHANIFIECLVLQASHAAFQHVRCRGITFTGEPAIAVFSKCKFTLLTRQAPTLVFGQPAPAARPAFGKSLGNLCLRDWHEIGPATWIRTRRAELNGARTVSSDDRQQRERVTRRHPRRP